MTQVEYQTTLIYPNLAKGVVERLTQPVRVICDDDTHEFYFFGGEGSASMTVRVTRHGLFRKYIGPPESTAPLEQTLQTGQRLTITDLTKEITFWLAELPDIRPKGF